MRIHNVHERTLPIDAAQAWALVDSLGTRDDRLWPKRWPAMRRTEDIAQHAFVKYRVVGREPGQSLRFRFRDMPGFEGEHAFEIQPAGAQRLGAAPHDDRGRQWADRARLAPVHPPPARRAAGGPAGRRRGPPAAASRPARARRTVTGASFAGFRIVGTDPG